MIRLLFITLTIYPVMLWAQVSSEEVIIEQLHPDSDVRSSRIRSVIEMWQDGIGHQAIVQAENSYIQIQQLGQNHISEVTQFGTDTQWHVNQEGNHNQYTGTVIGDNNWVEIKQRGEDNLIYQDLHGNDMHYRITQEGQNNELIQLEYDPLAPAYEVHQQGAGIKIVIEQGFMGLPLSEP